MLPGAFFLRGTGEHFPEFQVRESADEPPIV